MASARFLQCIPVGALRLVLWAPALLSGAVSCFAQQPSMLKAYPTKPLRIITASSPGTAEDFFARALGGHLGAFYRQRVIIENRPGAGGLIGNSQLSRANADGYTLGMISVTRIVTALMREEPPYQALADIAGVAHVASITNVLVIAPALPARSAIDFVRHARGHVGELNYASLGMGSASHLAGEIFSRGAGIRAVHVPFRQITDAFVEMGLGRVHYAVLALPGVRSAVRDGRLRALAVMTPERSPALPEVPAIAEFGLPEAQFDSWSGIVAPDGTPQRVVEQLHGDIVRVLRKPALRELFAHQGAESTPESTPDGFTRLLQKEYARYQTLIREERISVMREYALAQ